MPIYIRNLSSGDVLNYSLPILVGDVRSPASAETVIVHNKQSQAEAISWPVIDFKFKALVDLSPGENEIELRSVNDVTVFTLHLLPSKLTKFVRPIYICCRDDPGEFQGPDDENRSPSSAVRRIALAARMLQTFTAEKLNDHGFGRQTFALETDLYPKRAACLIFESQLSVDEVHKMTGTELWTYFARELMSSDMFKDDRDQCKWFAFMSFTRYYLPPSTNPPSSHSEVVSLTKGHTALGGGGLALCGTGTLHCWAETVDEVVHRFTDQRRIDRSKLMDDSAYREFYWANYATGLGAALHELGHTFDLAHSPTGIMSRGFDDIHRFFTIVTPVASFRGMTSSCRLQRSCSPTPCSAAESPVRRPALECNSSMSSSPRHSSNSCLLRRVSSTEPAAVIVVESSFSRLHVQTSHTTHVQNYDRSEVTTTSTRHKDGVETVSQVVVWPDGRVMIHELVRNMTSGKSRMTMSMTKPADGRRCRHETAASNSSCVDGSVTSNSLRDTATMLPFQQSRYRDGGAHWYRSSAVMLHYHRWLSASPTKEYNKNTIEMTGCVVQSAVGIRLVELRKGSVCHHWEFLAENPPTEFTICIDDVHHLVIENDVEVVVVVEDSAGAILKRKLLPDELHAS